jgi:GNAT superfamily N-acetyltransferase
VESISYGVAKQDDMADLVSLLSTLFSIEKDFNPDTSKQMAGLTLLLNSKAGSIQVARNAAGKVIGMVSAQLVISTAQGAASAWVEDMVIAADYRRLGIGKTLLQNALDWAKQNGATRAQLLVDTSNADAINYYQQLDWEPTQLQARRVFL